MIRLIALSVCAILSLSAQVGGPGAPATGSGVFSAIASQAEAQAGTNNTKGMTPLRTAEAIAALAAGGTQSMVVNAQTGTNYTVLTTDRAKLVTFCNASPVAVALPQASVSFPDGWYFVAKNICAGDVTITPSTSTVSGAASIVLSTGEIAPVVSDGTNYEALSSRVVAGTGAVLTKARTGVTVASNPTGTTSACFQLETGGTGPKLCDEANGLQIKTSADAVMATLTTAGVLTLGDGTAPWNLTGLTDDVAPGAPASANQFTTYFDRADGLLKWRLYGEASPKVAVVAGTQPCSVSIGFTGSEIADNKVAIGVVPAACTLTGWELRADAAVSATVDIERANYATWTGTLSGASIVGAGVKPAASSATKAQDTDLSDWTSLALAADDTVEAILSGVTVGSATKLVLVLKGLR